MVIQAEGQKCPFSCINIYNHKQSRWNTTLTLTNEFSKECPGKDFNLGRIGNNIRKGKENNNK